VAAPQARGLFHRASVRSGGGFFNATRPLAQAEREGLEFGARVGVSGDDAAALQRLRSLTTDQVLAGDPPPPNFGAVIDGKLLREPASVSLSRGDVARVPLMTGSTSDEASIFGLMGFDRKVLASRFGVDVDALRPAYEGQGALGDAELLRQVQTDFIFTSASVGMTALAARAGMPAYVYHFDHLDADQRGQRRGAPHCADMGYLFGRTDLTDARDAGVARELQEYLLNFMRSGDPNGPGLPRWPRADGSTIEPLVIGETTRAVPGFRSRQLQPWFAKWQTESGASLDLR
jgi:para-nitrobenzyl esterase